MITGMMAEWMPPRESCERQCGTISRDSFNPYPTNTITCELSSWHRPQSHTQVHQQLYSLHLRRIRAGLRDVHDSHLAMLRIAVLISIAFYTTWWSYLLYGCLGIRAMALGGQQLRLRRSHRCNRGAVIADHVAAPKEKYNNSECSKVASRYDSRLPLTNITIATWLDDQIGSLYEERKPSVPTPFKFHQMYANKRMWICAHTTAYEEGF